MTLYLILLLGLLIGMITWDIILNNGDVGESLAKALFGSFLYTAIYFVYSMFLSIVMSTIDSTPRKLEYFEFSKDNTVHVLKTPQGKQKYVVYTEGGEAIYFDTFEISTMSEKPYRVSTNPDTTKKFYYWNMVTHSSRYYLPQQLNFEPVLTPTGTAELIVN
jgi:membrane-anchored glycerophosphoryl diester phosphodiesterase (GDPDase)